MLGLTMGLHMSTLTAASPDVTVRSVKHGCCAFDDYTFNRILEKSIA